MVLDDTLRKLSSKTAFKGFWIGVLIVLVAGTLTVREPTFGGLVGGGLVLLATLLPAYLWIRRKNNSIPVFPLYVSTIAITHGLPLWVAPDAVMQYSSDEQLRGGYTVAISIIAGTIIWAYVRRIPAKPVRAFRQIKPNIGDKVFIAALAGCALLAAAMTGGWLADAQEGIVSIVRAALLAAGALGSLALGYRQGRRELSKPYIVLFQLLMVANAVAFSASLLLNTAISYVLLALIGFSLGRHRIQWALIIPIVLVFTILHAGKGEIRDQYWHARGTPYLSPVDYPRLYADWTIAGLTNFQNFGDEADSTSLLNRAGLVYLLLHVQSLSPETLPYVEGASYSHIIRLLVPRLLDPDKPGAHDGTVLLNVYYGLQTLDTAAYTTIGWGLLNEAYANFGVLGSIGLFVLLGAFLALVERWSSNLPLLSFRSLWTILLLSMLVTSDATMGVFIAALFQGTVVLVAVSALLMNTQRSTTERYVPHPFGAVIKK